MRTSTSLSQSPLTYWSMTVDTEEEWDWSGGFPTQDPTVENITRLPQLQAICDAHSVAVTYFVNYAVLANPISREVIQELARKPNVEIGLHIHPWNTPPLSNVSHVPVRESFLHNLPWDLARAKLDATLGVFDAAGLAPTSFRGGRYSSSPQIQQYLRDHGVFVDASVLPFLTWHDDGAPDYRERDLLPVRLPPRDASDAAMWELPLTYGYTRRPFAKWHRIVQRAETGVWNRLRTVGAMGLLNVVRKAWLNLEGPLGEENQRFLHVLRQERLPFVCFTLHSSSLMPEGSPYTRSAAEAERLLEATDRAFAEVADYPEFVPATISQTALNLETAYHACARD